MSYYVCIILHIISARVMLLLHNIHYADSKVDKYYLLDIYLYIIIDKSYVRVPS